MGGGKPRQADLRRAVSTIYYALFHALCRNCADSLIGTKGSDRSNPAWRQAYRSVGHKYAKRACSDQRTMKFFPKEIEDFGNTFVSSQIKRLLADYDPSYRVTRSEVLTDIKTAESAMKKLRASRIKHRRAFAAWVTLMNRE